MSRSAQRGIELAGDASGDDAALPPDASPMTPPELRAHLAAFGLTQTELARLLGTNPRTVRRWLEHDRPGQGPAQGPGIPGAVATTLHAWQRLQRAGLPWRPHDAPLNAVDASAAMASQRFYALDIDAMLERVRARGGPAVPWDVDLARQRATVGAVQLTFYLLEGEGFVPLSYRRQDALMPEPVRDQTLLEDGVACIARTLERRGQPAAPSLWLGPAAVVGGSTLVLWEQRPIPTIAVILPLAVARAVLGPLATGQELRERVDRNRAVLSTLAQALVDEGAGTVNELGVRELRLDEALLRLARPRTLENDDKGGSGQGGQGGQGAQGREGVGPNIPGGAVTLGRAA